MLFPFLKTLLQQIFLITKLTKLFRALRLDYGFTVSIISSLHQTHCSQTKIEISNQQWKLTKEIFIPLDMAQLFYECQQLSSLIVHSQQKWFVLEQDCSCTASYSTSWRTMKHIFNWFGWPRHKKVTLNSNKVIFYGCGHQFQFSLV